MLAKQKLEDLADNGMIQLWIVRTCHATISAVAPEEAKAQCLSAAKNLKKDHVSAASVGNTGIRYGLPDRSTARPSNASLPSWQPS